MNTDQPDEPLATPEGAMSWTCAAITFICAAAGGGLALWLCVVIDNAFFK